MHLHAINLHKGSMVAVIAAALLISTAGTARAAETVIGNGPAEDCYRAAENGSPAPRDSITFCDEALASILAPRDRAATYVNRGILKMGTNDSTGSLTDFNSGLQMRSDMGEGYVDRGASLIMMNKFAEALADIDKGLALGVKKPQIAYYDRGLANEGLGKLEAAYHDYKQSELIDPYFTPPTVELKRFKVVTKPAGT